MMNTLSLGAIIAIVFAVIFITLAVVKLGIRAHRTIQKKRIKAPPVWSPPQNAVGYMNTSYQRSSYVGPVHVMQQQGAATLYPSQTTMYPNQPNVGFIPPNTNFYGAYQPNPPPQSTTTNTTAMHVYVAEAHGKPPPYNPHYNPQLY